MVADGARADVDCWLTHRPLETPGYVFEQRYKGGCWRVMMDRLEAPCRVHVRASRLGRAMVAQAGVGSVLRYLLGGRGVAWLHAAVLVRAGRVVVLAGPSGVGKSQLVLRAIRDGWRYLTDDHALVTVGRAAGVGGITTPVLVRSYGGWPEGLDCPPCLAQARRWASALRRLTWGHINLMSGYTPVDDKVQTGWLGAGEIKDVRVCWLEPTARAVGEVSEMAPEMLLEHLDRGAHRAGQFMDGLLASEVRGRCTGLAQAFWQRQSAVLSEWLSMFTGAGWLASVPRALNEQNARALWSKLRLNDD